MTGKELLTAFVLGGAAYGAIELVWRGHTHWTMVLAGGVCYVFMYLIASHTGLGRLWQYLLCAGCVTAVEFLTGAVVNVALGWGVWDYSDRPLNLYGQVCLLYSLYWLGLSIPGCALARLLRRLLVSGG